LIAKEDQSDVSENHRQKYQKLLVQDVEEIPADSGEIVMGTERKR